MKYLHFVKHHKEELVYHKNTKIWGISMRIKQKLLQFMYGRRGVDEFSRATLILAIAAFVLSCIFKGILSSLFWLIAVASIVYSYYRVLSRNIYKRQQENEWYLQKKNVFKNWLASLKDRWNQRKDYRFFRCPSCRALLRVPKNKGKLLLTCRKCGNRFERKT